MGGGGLLRLRLVAKKERVALVHTKNANMRGYKPRQRCRFRCPEARTAVVFDVRLAIACSFNDPSAAPSPSHDRIQHPAFLTSSCLKGALPTACRAQNDIRNATTPSATQGGASSPYSPQH